MKKSKLAFLPVAVLAFLAVSCDASKPTSPVETTDKFNQITGARWIKANDKDDIQSDSVLLLSEGNKSPKTLNNGALSAKDAKYGRVDTDQELLQLKATKYMSGKYRLNNKDGQYLAAKDGALTFEQGVNYWTLNVSNGKYYFSPYESELVLSFDENKAEFALKEQSSGLDVYLGYDEKFVYPTSIEITGNNQVEINGALPLNITCAPAETTEKDVTWYCSDESLASVSADGIVTGKGVGEVTITAVSNHDSTITAQYTVNVIAKKIRVTGLSLAYDNYIFYEGDAPQRIVATITPSDATNKLINWMSSNPNVVSVDNNGNISAVAQGEATITAITDDGGIRRTANVSVKQAKQREQWQLVSEEGDLSTDYEVVLVAGDYNAVAGSFNRSYFSKDTNSVFSTDKTNIEELSDKATRLILSKDSSGYYHFENQDGQNLGATKSGSLSFTGGETRWNITFNSGNAYIKSANANYGSIQYTNSNRMSKFTTYTSEETPIQIYRNKLFEKVYPENININGEDAISIDGSTQYTLGFEPGNTNVRRVTWSVTNTSVATISNTGYLTAVNEGKTQVVVEGIGANGSRVISTKDIEIKPISVTGVSLNFSTKEVAVNKSFNLVPTVYPSNATHKEVTFSSDDPSIASINNNGKVTAKQEGSTTIRVVTKDGGFEASVKVDVVPSRPAEWTIMLYVCGADLESGSGLATSDISEILSVSNQPDDVNIIIQTGGAHSWSYKYVEDQKLVLDESIADASMGSSNTFKEFIKWGLTEYPANKTGVDMWNHGGAMGGVCYDEKHGSDSLSNIEVNKGMADAFEELGRTEKLEWIGYDACLMAVQDIAEFNSHYFNYMVSSEETETGYGWDYDGWVDDLYDGKPTETVLKAICDSFLQSTGSYSDQTLSVINLNYMEIYRSAWETMSTKLKEKINNSNRSSFNSLVKSAQSYYGSTSSYGIFDARDFLDKLANSSSFNPGSNYVQDAKDAFDNLVIHSKAGTQAGNSHGMCLYWAASSGCRQSSVYTANHTNFTNWRSIVTTYGY